MEYQQNENNKSAAVLCITNDAQLCKATDPLTVGLISIMGSTSHFVSHVVCVGTD